MSKLALTLFVVSVVACGGTTDSSGEQPQGGSPAGGAGQAGSGGAGAAGAAGAAGNEMGGAGGSSAGAAGRAGSDSGGASGGTGGSAGNGGNGGSGGLVDARCPAKQPSAECGAGDTGLTCRYDLATGCLCYNTSSFGFCQYVDSYCPTGASSGRPAAPAEGGTGGVTTKVALPPQMKCVCSAGVWSCAYGF